MASPPSFSNIPSLNIVMHVVGTRGDVQPFIAYGQALQSFGHRVRLATHKVFQKPVRDNGLGFFLLAGDPDELMRYMVQNGGIRPGISALVRGHVWQNERTVHEILRSTWHSCISDDEETGIPFVADVIIANPPSFGHIHCAEKLGIPLHMVFTMPWSATANFPHPFTLFHNKRNGSGEDNIQSYAKIDSFTWLGTNIVTNHFRQHTLKLAPLDDQRALHIMEGVPHTYCWSPSLVAKPADWGPHIDVCGFFHSDANYDPPQDLRDFLQNGDPPMYIGFGSISGHDQHRLIGIVKDALKKTGRRAVVCNRLATPNDRLPGNIFPIGDCPHDWIFQRVDAVCHHGGAGTTAAGLRAGLPTIVCAFFGDQFFWGNVVQNIGAGPPSLSGQNLSVADLVKAIQFVYTNPSFREAAQNISEKIKAEDGCSAALSTFHDQLPLANMQSDLESTYAASFRIPQYNLQVSWPVALVLLNAEQLTRDQLIPMATHEWNLTNSSTPSTPPNYRMPSEFPRYSDDECTLILSRYAQISGSAQLRSQQTTTSSYTRTRENDTRQG